jgi:hypothetical protein
MPGSGEKPGAGTYACTHDGQQVILESEDDVLMECPVCGGFEYSLVARRGVVEPAEERPRLVAVLGYKQCSSETTDEKPKLDALAP